MLSYNIYISVSFSYLNHCQGMENQVDVNRLG
jgi:hypothetical protein